MSARGGDTQGVASASSDVAGASDARAEGFNDLGPVALPRIGREEREEVDLREALEWHLRHPRMILSPAERDAIYWQGRPAEEDAAVGPPPKDPVEARGAAESSDRRAASRSRSPRAPRRRGPSQMWLDALCEAQLELAEEGIHPRNRVHPRAREIMARWRKSMESEDSSSSSFFSSPTSD